MPIEKKESSAIRSTKRATRAKPQQKKSGPAAPARVRQSRLLFLSEDRKPVSGPKPSSPVPAPGKGKGDRGHGPGTDPVQGSAAPAHGKKPGPIAPGPPPDAPLQCPAVESVAAGSVEEPDASRARAAALARKRLDISSGPLRTTAQVLATKQREISVSEFFAKNRHLLGFDNPRKALLTTVKEGVDNSLDACEEAGILPLVIVQIQQRAEDRFVVTIEDNGPGIVKAQIPRIFGKLLYGSKFHRLRMSRGQQGIGISAAGMYGLLTTGKPVKIMSKVS
ncbi:MAG: ATP-binding protein, partial [Planctomycetota bacterium]|nr:ATP-binding protein [Planctomycetota bacterium]